MDYKEMWESLKERLEDFLTESIELEDEQSEETIELVLFLMKKYERDEC